MDVHKRTRSLDVKVDSMFGSNMGKLAKLRTEDLRVSLLKVLELRRRGDDGDVLQCC